MRSKLSSLRDSLTISSRCFSAPRQILSIALIALTGNFPTAVSADSITASVPSSTALATSVTSARVGICLSIIDSSICVAVMTTRSRLRPWEIIFFCTAVISASPISTPRSPRATINTSDASVISSMTSMASARSILETIHASLPALCSRCLASCTSSALRTNETARKSASIAAASLMSFLSFSVNAPADKPPP
ncbi:hypothetical protein BMS3Bbin11_01546 [bacterium BMS3Bbin11]|nr:hypothetical protein BMS3Bbin11_01546 [bacterium BMS3Bbin11]